MRHRPRGRQHEREQRDARRSTHGRQVAEVHRERFVTDVCRRHECLIEMHAFDHRVRGDHVEQVPLRLDHGGVITDADDHPGRRRWDSRPDPLDEGALTKVGNGLCQSIVHRPSSIVHGLPIDDGRSTIDDGLFRVFHRASLAYHRHLDVPGILQLVLDAARDVFRKPDRFLV